MEAKEIVAEEVARQAKFGMEPSWEDFVIAGQKVGAREVLEQYKAIRACTHMAGLHHLADCKECEQAQLKEWGL